MPSIFSELKSGGNSYAVPPPFSSEKRLKRFIVVLKRFIVVCSVLFNTLHLAEMIWNFLKIKCNVHGEYYKNTNAHTHTLVHTHAHIWFICIIVCHNVCRCMFRDEWNHVWDMPTSLDMVNVCCGVCHPGSQQQPLDIWLLISCILIVDFYCIIMLICIPRDGMYV